MALLQFTQDLPADELLDAFNNQVVVFNSPSASPAVKATITVNTVPFVITPDPDGNFTYNFSRLFRTIVNANNFRDGVTTEVSGVTSNPPYIYQDTDVLKEIDVDFEVLLEDDSTDTASKTYQVLRSVTQLEDHRRSLLKQNNPELTVLLPYAENASDKFHATYFEGYPFDLPIFSDVTRQLQITHEGTQQTATVNLEAGVNRLFVSNGSSNWSFENVLPLHTGVNELTLQPLAPFTQKPVTVYLTKKQGLCGTFLKWFNQSGGWCYFLFNASQVNRKTKSLGVFSGDHSNLDNTHETQTQIGVTSQDTIDVFYSSITPEEKVLVDTILESPKVYRCLVDVFQDVEDADWISERIKSGNGVLYNRRLNVYEDGFTIIKAERFKMTF